jgi:uncharacterized protein (TIGR03437 family)
MRTALILLAAFGPSVLCGQSPSLPIIHEFQAIPKSIQINRASMLVWRVEGATAVSISGIGPVPPAGSATVFPAAGTTYILRASSAAGEVAAATTVSVSVPTGFTLLLTDLSSLDFHDVVAGESANRTIRISCVFCPPVLDISLDLSDRTSSFSVLGPTSMTTGGPVTIRFAPRQPGGLEATLKIVAPSIPASLWIPLRGGGVASTNSIMITGFANAGTPHANIASDTWLTIYGRNLADTTRAWTPQDMPGGVSPTVLGGISVLIDGRPGYVSYVSPTQINVLTPGSFGGEAVITTRTGRSNPIALEGEPYRPQFLMFGPQFRYVAAALPDGTFVAPAGIFGAAAASRPARAGDRVAVYLTGVGPAMRSFLEGNFRGPTPVDSDIHFSLSVSRNGFQQSTTVKGDYFVQIGLGLYQTGFTFPSFEAGDVEISFLLSNTNSGGSGYILAGN